MIAAKGTGEHLTIKKIMKTIAVAVKNCDISNSVSTRYFVPGYANNNIQED